MAERSESLENGSAAESIVAAAVRRGDLVWSLPRPARHHNILHALHAETGDALRCEQGFLTSDGRFIGREDARQMVIANGQCPEPPHQRMLFSEDLW